MASAWAHSLCGGGGRHVCLKYLGHETMRVRMTIGLPGLSPVFAECHLDATAAPSPSPPPPRPAPSVRERPTELS